MAIRIDLSSLQGCTSVTLQHMDLQGDGHLVRERSTEAIRHSIVHLSNSTERSSAGLNPKYAGPWTPNLTYSCMVRGWPVKHNQIQTTLLEQIRQHHFPAQAAVLLTSEESSNETTKRRSPYSFSHV